MIEENLGKVSMCKTSTGMSNIIGNCTMVIKDFFKSLFPNNFFKSEWIDTEMVQNEMYSKDIISKKDKPCLVIHPKFSLEDNTFFGTLPDWINTNFYVFKKLRRNYAPVFADEENKIFMYCSGERIKIQFDIEIVLDTKIQQINTGYYLKGSILHNGNYFYINDTRLESEIPKYYINQIANIMNKDLSNPNDRTEFNKYLNEHSQNFIQEKIKLSNGNFNHFYLFTANLLSVFDGYPDMDDGETEGMTTNNFKITENFSVEFWSPLNYFLEVGRKFDIIPPKDHNFLEDLGSKINLHYTMKFPLPERVGDMVYVTKIMYITDEDPESDTVNIAELFTPRDIELIRYAREHKVLLGDIFKIDLYLDNYKVDDSSVLIDWDKMTLTNIRPKINEAYTLVLYRSNERYNRVENIMDNLRDAIYNK